MFCTQGCYFWLLSGVRQVVLKLIAVLECHKDYLCVVQDWCCFHEEQEHMAWGVSVPSLVHLLSFLLLKVKDRTQLTEVSKVTAVALQTRATFLPCFHTRHSKFF